MLPDRPAMRHLIPLLLVLTCTATNVVPVDTKADDGQRPDAEIHGGKTLDEWIEQAKQGRRLEDREDALQTLRNVGLRHDRDKTLRAFTELLSDKAPTVRSLAAVGLRKAGKPTDPMAAAKLVEIISPDLSRLKLPKKPGEVGAEFGGVMRAIGALEVIGETDHIPVLKRVSENQKVDSIIRQAAEKAIRQIEKRARVAPPESVQAPKTAAITISAKKMKGTSSPANSLSCTNQLPFRGRRVNTRGSRTLETINKDKPKAPSNRKTPMG